MTGHKCKDRAILEARITALETAVVEYLEKYGLTERAAIALSAEYILNSEERGSYDDMVNNRDTTI